MIFTFYLLFREINQMKLEDLKKFRIISDNL